MIDCKGTIISLFLLNMSPVIPTLLSFHGKTNIFIYILVSQEKDISLDIQYSMKIEVDIVYKYNQKRFLLSEVVFFSPLYFT